MFSPEIHYYEDLHKSKQIKNMLFKKYFNQLCGVANIWSCAKWLTLCGTLVDERNECFGDSNAHWCKTPLYLAAVVWLCQILTSCFSESKKTGGVFVRTLFDKKDNTPSIFRHKQIQNVRKFTKKLSMKKWVEKIQGIGILFCSYFLAWIFNYIHHVIREMLPWFSIACAVSENFGNVFFL